MAFSSACVNEWSSSRKMSRSTIDLAWRIAPMMGASPASGWTMSFTSCSRGRAFVGAGLELDPVQPRVFAVRDHQLFVRAAFDDTAFIQDEDHVRAADGG